MTVSAEDLKRDSRHLRGTLAEELASPEPGFAEGSQQLLKPHGLYQQTDRDARKAAKAAGVAPPLPAIMARGRLPGGRLDARAWAVWDALADTYGDGSLRITTRQSLELHGILKGDLKATLKGLRDGLQTTTGACGDVVRNVVAPPNPTGRPELARLAAEAARLSDHFKAASRAYAEIFLDGEAVPPETEVEPLYGETYLPRKFKIALTLAGENAVDLLTHDLGFAATLDGGELTGWHVFAGGGMGMTHGNDQTFPRLADHLGWIPAEALLAAAEAVVALHRDFGDRGNRRRARLKYVLHDHGADWARAEVAARSGVPFEDRPLPSWSTPSLLGWHEAADGTWSFGLHTLSGRIAGARKRALADLIAAFALGVQLTPEQDLILTGIRAGDRSQIEARLDPSSLAPSPLATRALACVALPWCGLAVAEAERALPAFLEGFEAALARHGKSAAAPTFRVTGCANGCARPYAAELALVGQAPDRYVLWAGGSAEGTELAFPVRDKVTPAELPDLFDRLVATWAAEGLPGEPFGAFARRLRPAGLAEALAPKSLAPGPWSLAAADPHVRSRLDRAEVNLPFPTHPESQPRTQD